MKKRYLKDAGGKNSLMENLGLSPIFTRDGQGGKDKMTTRTISLRFEGDIPVTLDTDKRTVEVLASTENPVMVWDWDHGRISEVLLMSGLEMPAARKVPLLDAHSRYATSDVVGSFRDMRTNNGELTGVAHFSRAADAEGPWTKLCEGHLTDFSVGYEVDRERAIWIPDGQTATVEGREFEGPLKVVTFWKIRELSVVPIGADEHAKARTGQPSAPQKKESDVDKKLRAFLERRGLDKDATDGEAWAFLERLEAKQEVPADNKPENDPQEDIDGEREAATMTERHRISEITAMGTRFDCSELSAGLVKDGLSVDKARKAVMDHLAEDSGTEGGTGHRAPVDVGKDEREKFRAAATGAVMLKAGLEADKPADGADELAGRSLVELGRMSLVRAGQSDNGHPLQMIGRALTTSDFPLILAAAANKSLDQGFEQADETWKIWCGTGSVNDFKTHSAVRASEGVDLDEVPEGTEYKYGSRSEQQEQYSVVTYGKLLAITRQAIINDDLGALSDIPAMHGETVARKIGDVGYAVLTANSAMGDNKALFIAAHNNLMTAAALGVTSLAAGIKAMGTQKDILGKRRLNIKPVFFLAPKALEGSSEVFFLSNNFEDTAKDSTRVNPYSGKYFQRVYEGRLDDDSATAWYLAAAINKTVRLFFLHGQQKPYMEARQGWSVDGVEYKVRLDVGAKAMDWRGLQKNAGA